VIRTDEDRREAVRLKKEEIRKDPTNSRLWRELGSLYQDLKDWTTAEKVFRKALEVNPHDLFVTEKIGALREAKYDEELEGVRAEVEAASSSGQDGAALKEKLQQKEKEVLEFKVEEYDRRVKAHPTDYELKVRYGQVLMNAEQFDEAIKQFQSAVKDPKFKIQSLNLIGSCFKSKGLFDVAEQQYRQGLDSIADKESELGKELQYNLGVVCEKRRTREAP